MSSPLVTFEHSKIGLFWVLGAIGILTFVIGLAISPDRTWVMLLTVSYLLIGIGVGAAFFLSAMYCAGATWGIALRRVWEAMTAALPLGAIGLGFILIIHPTTYPWINPSPEVLSHLTGFKAFWLNRWFMLARSVLYILIWLLLIRLVIRNSRRQDHTGDLQETFKAMRYSAAFLAVFAVTFWLAAYDWIMSLEPLWYSSIFGIYGFAGWFLTTLVIGILLILWLERQGALSGVLTENHLHDLGKLVFAFSTFWMYIWFSQYMLIWYANIPEETTYYILRHRGIWASLALLNLFLNWIIPFFALLSRRAKRDRGVVARVCAVLLLGRCVDIYLMVAPPVVGSAGAPGLIELGLFLGGAGGFLLLIRRKLGAAPVVPHGDPLLSESLSYHQ